MPELKLMSMDHMQQNYVYHTQTLIWWLKYPINMRSSWLIFYKELRLNWRNANSLRKLNVLRNQPLQCSEQNAISSIWIRDLTFPSKRPNIMVYNVSSWFVSISKITNPSNHWHLLWSSFFTRVISLTPTVVA